MSAAVETIAARLIELLPRAAPFDVPAPKALLATASIRPPRLFIALANCAARPTFVVGAGNNRVLWNKPRAYSL